MVGADSGTRHVGDDIDYADIHYDDIADHNHDGVNDIDYYEYANILHPDSQHVR